MSKGKRFFRFSYLNRYFFITLFSCFCRVLKSKRGIIIIMIWCFITIVYFVDGISRVALVSRTNAILFVFIRHVLCLKNRPGQSRVGTNIHYYFHQLDSDIFIDMLFVININTKNNHNSPKFIKYYKFVLSYM